MSVQYILSQVGSKIGLNPAVAGQRAVLLRFVNEAAWELYNQADVAGSLMEQVFKVNGDQTISLPSYVGALRAVREFYSQIPWHINQMRPRYNYANWPDMWRNYRLIGKSALQKSIVNQSLITAVVSVVEDPPVVVMITGRTPVAENTSELLIMDALSKTTTNNFLDITRCGKDRVNNYNVSIRDVDDVELTVIPNNELDAQYLIVDISTFPWSNRSQSQNDHYVEVLYKKALPLLSEDGDEFPSPGCDNILVNKCMQLWAEEQGKGDQAIGYDGKASRSLARLLEDQNRATEDCVLFVPNPHDQLLPRVRQWRYGRYLFR